MTCKNGACVDKAYRCLYGRDRYNFPIGCRDATHLANCGKVLLGNKKRDNVDQVISFPYLNNIRSFKGYCTPYLKLTYFVCYLKNINTFF